MDDPSRALFWTFHTGESPAAMEALRPQPGSAGPSSATWTCANATAAPPNGALPKPYYHHQLLHPCASQGNAADCCGRAQGAAIHVALRAWFDLDQVLVIITYEVWPKCGDGVTIASEDERMALPVSPCCCAGAGLLIEGLPRVSLWRAVSVQEAGGRTHELHQKLFAQADNAQRQTQRLLLPNVAAGSQIVFSAHAGGTDDCDGVYLAEWQVWRVADAEELALT
jgi:hypothetical protein